MFTAIRLVGDLHIAKLDGNDKPLGFLSVLNATSMSVNTGTVENKQRLSRRKNDNGAVLNNIASVTEGATITIENNEFPPDILALQVRGSYVKSSINGATIAAESLKVIEFDKWIKLGNFQLAADDVTASEGATNYEEGTDFVINRDLGLIKFLSTSTTKPAIDDILNVNYKTLTRVEHQVDGSTELPPYVMVLMDGINQTSGKKCRVEVNKGMLSADGELDLLTEEFVSGSFVITPVTLNGQPGYRYVELD